MARSVVSADITIMTRARNRHHAHLLMDRDVDLIVRETFYSALHMAEETLLALGISSDDAKRSVALFEAHDTRNLIDSHAIYKDERQLIQNTQQATQELLTLFEADHPHQD